MKQTTLRRILAVVAVSLVAGTCVVGPVEHASAAAATKVQPVQDVDNAARQPVLIGLLSGLTLQEGQNYSAWTTVYTVPDGKRLVIEYVDAYATTPGEDQHPAFLLQSADENYGPIFFADLKMPGSYTVHQAVRIYFDPGKVITARCYRATSLGLAGYFLRLHGYLVDLTP